MYDKKPNKALLHRREFFKKATKTVLPVMAAIAMPSFLMSCSKSSDDYWEDEDNGNDDSENGNSGGGSGNNGSGNDSGNVGNVSISSADGTINGYGYVDLGLSVKWATCNLDVAKSEGYGSYKEIVSGITGSKAHDIAWEIYKIYQNDTSDFSIAGSSYDPVTSSCGSPWYLPTKKDFEELFANCKSEFVTYKNVKGVKFTSKINGHSIFLPLSGYNMYVTGWKKYSVGENGYYWTSSVYRISKYQEQFSFYGLYLNGEKSSVKIQHDFDAYTIKASVRPVTKGIGGSNSCNGNCSSNCASNSTNSSCSNCDSSCSSGCKTSCDYNCAATCKAHCYGSCNDTCGGGCKAASKGTSCSGCARTCNNRCYQTCSYACSSNCQSSCVNGAK